MDNVVNGFLSSLITKGIKEAKVVIRAGIHSERDFARLVSGFWSGFGTANRTRVLRVADCELVIVLREWL